MNLERIERLLRDLRLANECAAAAHLDVEDIEGSLKFYERKLAAMKGRAAETDEAAIEALQNLLDVVGDECAAPLLIALEAENDDGDGREA